MDDKANSPITKLTEQASNLTVEAQAIHDSLRQTILNQITLNLKPIRFQQFMQSALYTPKLGYYQNNMTKFGVQGDFITAPEMGDIFAHSLVAAMLPVLQQLAQGSRAQILELGAGSGAMVISILQQLERLQALPERYFILEPSASLQSFQYQQIQEKIPHHLSRIEWLEHLPSNFSGVILANEVVDAIPCERIQRFQGEWYYQTVGVKEGLFAWQLSEDRVEQLPTVLVKANRSEYPEGYTTEIRPLQTAWLGGLSAALSHGVIIIADYGYSSQEYYHSQRTDGSLMAISRQQANQDPLANVGLQDITAHVDFTALAQTAHDCGLAIEGYSTQAGLIIDSQLLLQMEQQMVEADLVTRAKLSQQLQCLMMPGQMGELVKIIALSKGDVAKLNGFGAHQQLARL